jgi:hypothetical protein
MNNQEVFDKVLEHARTQLERAINEEGQCCYFEESGLKCFIGALIPDEVYEPEMEAVSIYGLVGEYQSMAELFNGVNLDLLVLLQQVHDYQTPGLWEQDLRIIAEDFELTYKEEK